MFLFIDLLQTLTLCPHRLTVEEIKSVHVVCPSLHLDIVQGSNSGRASSDALERAQHAPAVQSPLDAWEQKACYSIYRCADVDNFIATHGVKLFAVQIGCMCCLTFLH